MTLAYNNSMGKSTQRRGKSKVEIAGRPRISRRDCRMLARRKLARGREGCCKETPPANRLQQLLHEASLQCPICLQTLLWPVLAQCGHHFCLPCAEDLARHDYACGMCHSFEPNHDMRVDTRLQELVRIFLEKSESQERLIYEQRQKALQGEEEDRGVGSLSIGDYVDFWSIEEKCWRSVAVQAITEDGQILISESKDSKATQISQLSRRIAKHGYYTRQEGEQKNQVEQVESVVEIEPNQAFGVARVPHQMFGMPFYFNFFGNSQGMNYDLNDYLGFMPGLPQFRF